MLFNPLIIFTICVLPLSSAVDGKNNQVTPDKTLEQQFKRLFFSLKTSPAAMKLLRRLKKRTSLKRPKIIH
jgi:hypothetical protein